MFPGWPVHMLLELCDDPGPMTPPAGADESRHVAAVMQLVTDGMFEPESATAGWGVTRIPDQLSAAGLSTEVQGFKPGQDVSHATTIGKKALAVAKVLRLSPEEGQRLAALAGNVVELGLRLDIDVAEDGWAKLTYRHELFNMSPRPLTRLTRELWFENTDGPLVINAICTAAHRIAVQRTHDTAHNAKFACQISPALQPGDTATVSYTCTGGQFVEDHYWRQQIARYTRHCTIRIRLRGVRQLASFSALEEHPDGAENSATEDLLWDYDDQDVTITLTRDYLQPNQALTVRWAVAREPS